MPVSIKAEALFSLPPSRVLAGVGMCSGAGPAGSDGIRRVAALT